MKIIYNLLVFQKFCDENFSNSTHNQIRFPSPCLVYHPQLLLEDISEKYGVFIMVVVQATHTFDVNGCDALLYSSQK